MVVGEVTPPPRKHGGPGQPWLEQETAFLIDAYEERWYALKRGQLKAHQWEEVASGVGARLGLLRAPKSGTQCRHKIEKLRRRYRAERKRSGRSRWPLFDRMERLEIGPSPISVRPPPPLIEFKKRLAEEEEEDESEEDDDEEEDEDDDDDDDDGEDGLGFQGSTKVINGTVKDNFRSKSSGEEDSGGDGAKGALRDLVLTVKRFREGFVRTEMRRMEMMREMEREWIEMESRRSEMLLESQRQILESISRAVRSVKRPKHSPEA